MKHLPLLLLITLLSGCNEYVCTLERVSCYHLVKKQTDNTPKQAAYFDYRNKDERQFYGFHAAISPDLKEAYNINKHDTLYLDLPAGLTPIVVTDLTHKKWSKTIDIVEAPGTMYLYKQIHLLRPAKQPNFSKTLQYCKML